MEGPVYPSVINGVIVILIVLFCLGVILNAIGQVNHQFEYIFPPEFMEFAREALAAALGWRTFQSIKRLLDFKRLLGNKKEPDE